MKKLIVLLGALMLVGLGASFGQTALDPTSPYDHTIGRKVLTLQRWALAVDQAFEDAESSTNGILASNTVYIGSSANLAVSQPITGDIGITTAGVVSITSGSIVNADINAAAAIASTKLAGLSLIDTNTTVDTTANVPLFAGQILVGTVSNKAWVSKGTTTNDWIAIN